MKLLSVLFIYIVFLLLANLALGANNEEGLMMFVGGKRSLSEKKYLFFKAANPHIVKVSRDALTRSLRIEALKVGETFFLFQEVGSESPRRVPVRVAVKPKKLKKTAKNEVRVASCKRGSHIRFGEDCHFFLPGWDHKDK